METQQTSPGSFLFKWHDSIQNEGSFNSGMDDFPRINDATAHVDCQSWMAMFAEAMADISASLEEDGAPYQSDAWKIKKKLLENFVDPATNLTKDYSVKNDKKVYSEYFGYPSVLPLAFGIL